MSIGLIPGARVSLHVRLACALAVVRIACGAGHLAGWIALAVFAAAGVQAVVVRLASVAFVASDTFFALTLARRIALQTLRAERIALARRAVSRRRSDAAVEAELAEFAVSTLRVALAVGTETAAAGLLVQRLIEYARVRQAVAVALYIALCDK